MFFGGAAGPGKSFGLLMAAAMYVDVPGYHALILRTVLQDFKKPGALIEVASDWFGGTDAAWNGSEHRWTFPSGATIQFAYARTIQDLSHFKGPAYSFVGFDELTEFPERVYRGMSRVLRAPPVIPNSQGRTVPLRKRAASNPGGPGHGWVKTRFIEADSRAPDVVFVPATIHDNPHMDYEEYLRSLAHLDPVDRQRLIDGDWDVTEEGGKFNRHSIEVVDASAAPRPVKAVRYWDLAGTKPTATNPDPDWTVGLRLEMVSDGSFTIRDVIRGRWADEEVQDVVRATARLDGRGVPIYIEQDPGQAGKAQLNTYTRRVLVGFACRPGQTRIAGKNAAKEVRARPAAAAVNNRLVRIVRGEHTLAALDELAIFPNGNHDDVVDAFSGAFNHITLEGGSGVAQRGSFLPENNLPADFAEELWTPGLR